MPLLWHVVGSIVTARLPQSFLHIADGSLCLGNAGACGGKGASNLWPGALVWTKNGPFTDESHSVWLPTLSVAEANQDLAAPSLEVLAPVSFICYCILP